MSMPDEWLDIAVTAPMEHAILLCDGKSYLIPNDIRMLDDWCMPIVSYVVLTDGDDNVVGIVTESMYMAVIEEYRGQGYLSAFIKSGAFRQAFPDAEEAELAIGALVSEEDIAMKRHLMELAGLRISNEETVRAVEESCDYSPYVEMAPNGIGSLSRLDFFANRCFKPFSKLKPFSKPSISCDVEYFSEDYAHIDIEKENLTETQIYKVLLLNNLLNCWNDEFYHHLKYWKRFPEAFSAERFRSNPIRRGYHGDVSCEAVIKAFNKLIGRPEEDRLVLDIMFFELNGTDDSFDVDNFDESADDYDERWYETFCKSRATVSCPAMYVDALLQLAEYLDYPPFVEG